MTYCSCWKEGKLRPRGVKRLAYAHTSNKWYSWNWNFYWLIDWLRLPYRLGWTQAAWHHSNPPALTSWVLGSQVCNTTHVWDWNFWPKCPLAFQSVRKVKRPVQSVTFYTVPPSSLTEFSRTLGLKMTSMIIRCLTEMTRTATSWVSKKITLSAPKAK